MMKEKLMWKAFKILEAGKPMGCACNHDLAVLKMVIAALLEDCRQCKCCGECALFTILENQVNKWKHLLL